jgi:MFS family permease
MNELEPVTTPSRWGALGHRDFRFLWAARTISAVGDRITLLALPSTAILVLGATAGQVGALNAIGNLAWPVLGLFAGVWVDRLRRRRILITADLGRAVLIASIPVAYALGHLGLVQLYVVAGLVGVLTMFFDLAVSAHTPVIVPAADWADANAKVEMSSQAAYALGPGVAGALIDLLSAPIALLTDAASFLASAAFIGLTAAETGRRPAAGRRSLLREAGEGLRFIAQRPVLLRIAVGAAISNVGLLMGLTVQLLFLYRVVHLSPLLVGISFGVGSLGSLLGAAFTARLTARLGIHRVLIASSGLEGLSLLLIPLGLYLPIVPLLMLGLAGSAGGRVIAYGALPVGSLLGGLVGQFLSNRLGTDRGLALTLVLAALLAGCSALSMLSPRGFPADR